MTRLAILLTILASLVVGCGRDPRSRESADPSPSAAAGPNASAAPPTTDDSQDFDLTIAESSAFPADLEPLVIAKPGELPDNFPRTILRTEAEAFLAKQPTDGQGCGVMTWEGKICGMFSNNYQLMFTPWHPFPMSIEATYALTEKSTFLVELRLDSQVFRRNTREEQALTWRPPRLAAGASSRGELPLNKAAAGSPSQIDSQHLREPTR